MVSNPEKNKRLSGNKTFHQKLSKYSFLKEQKAKIILSREHAIRKVNNNIFLVRSQTGTGTINVVQILNEGVIFCGFTIDGGVSIGIAASDNNGGITISDNTISNCRDLGLGIFHDCNNNIVSDNTILNNEGDGISLYSSKSNTISGNTILNNGDDGIFLDYSDNNIISGNTISNHSYNIYLHHYCRNNIICNNKITEFHIGLFIEEYSHYSNIYWNNITNGNFSILIEDSHENEISQNTFKNCSIFLRESDKSQIYYNNFFDLKKYHPDGFFIDSRTKWLTNYWDRPIRFLKIIPGVRTISGFWKTKLLPDIDWRPALKPFKIPV